MSIESKSMELRGQGFNCAQSVFAACSDELGMEKELALAVAGGLGGGVRCGEICGALLGAAMAISKLHPYLVGDDQAARAEVSAAIEKLSEDFKAEFGHVRCQDLGTHGPDCDPQIAWCARAVQKAIENK